jgi:hypothetical protein
MNKMFLIVLAPGFFYFSKLAAIADKLVRFPEGNAAWMIEITPLVGAVDLGSGTGKKAQKVEIVQADNMKKIVITWNNGTSTEKWAVSNLPVTFKAAPDGTVYPVGNGRVEDLMDNMAAPINPSEFSWITSDNLQEKDPVSYEGTMCFHYLGTASIFMPAGKAPKRERRETWINSKTLFPVALDTGTTHCVFTFLPPPNTSLEMPEKFKKEIAYYKAIMGLP